MGGEGLPVDNSCLFLGPPQIWAGDKVRFLSDPDIAETLLGDKTSSKIRGLLFKL